MDPCIDCNAVPTYLYSRRPGDTTYIPFCSRCYHIRAFFWFKYNATMPSTDSQAYYFLKGYAWYWNPDDGDKAGAKCEASRKEFPYTLSPEQQLEFDAFIASKPDLTDNYTSVIEP